MIGSESWVLTPSCSPTVATFRQGRQDHAEYSRERRGRAIPDSALQGASSSSAFELERNKDQIEVLSKSRNCPRPGDVVRDPAAREGNSRCRQSTGRDLPAEEKTSGLVLPLPIASCFSKGRTRRLGRNGSSFSWRTGDTVAFVKHPRGDDARDGHGQQSKQFWDHPFFQKHRAEVKILQEGVAQGSFPGASQGLHANLGLLVESKALGHMFERIIKDKVAIEKAVALAQKELEADLAKK